MKKNCYLIIFFIIFLNISIARADIKLDTDQDGVPDEDEFNIYKTDYLKKDTDGDGYNDFLELNNGYSPLNPAKIKLENNDYDNDGLTDRIELNFQTDIANPDSDKDGYKDGEEIKNGYDPLDLNPTKLKKRIEINTKNQKMDYYLKNIRLGTFPVSSGKNNSTPKGNLQIINKSLKAWSSYGLWMPYWLGLTGGKVGIHELPIWPNGYREGANHLGIPVSHGCIRLGIGPAKTIYDWADIGTAVTIF